MSQDFFNEHHDKITQAIKNKPIVYTINSGKNIAVHCYYVDTPTVCIATYAIKNKKTHSVSKYILKISVNGSKSELCDDTARITYNSLCARYSEQIAKTQLKQNFENHAFIRKR